MPVIRSFDTPDRNNYKIKSHNIKTHAIPDWISNATVAAAIVLIFGARLSAASIIPPARPFYCEKRQKIKKIYTYIREITISFNFYRHSSSHKALSINYFPLIYIRRCMANANEYFSNYDQFKFH